MTAARKTLILASASPRRQELISLFNLPVKIQPSDVDENVPPGTSPGDMVEQLALRKALAVQKRCREEGTDGIVVGSDTIVVLDGRILGKPQGRTDAVRMLRTLQGSVHEVYTGLSCIDTAWSVKTEHIDRVEERLSRSGGSRSLSFGQTGRIRILDESDGGNPLAALGHTVSRVTFRPMKEDEIEAYVRSGEPLDKAGAYGIQGLGSFFVERIEGDYYSIMGLPVSLLYGILQTFGLNPLQQHAADY